MGAFGERLRREREMRGISLDEIVAATKIGTRLLRALEDEQFDLLPGGIFNKGYVRAYAKYVGIDEEQAVADYLAAAEETPPEARVIAQQHASIYADRPTQTGFPFVPVLILLVVVIAGAAGWKLYQTRQREREQRPTPAADTTAQPEGPAAGASTETSEQPAAASSAPATNSNSPAAVQRAPAKAQASASSQTVNTGAGTSFELTIRPKDRAWVAIKSDGEFVVRGIIKPPDVKTIRASDQVIFWTGNAGAVEVSFNGKNVPLTGGPNDEQMLVFNSRGVQPKAPAQ